MFDDISYFHQACNNIVLAGNDPKQVKQVNYAYNYAQRGLTITDKHEAKIQSLYILNNITHWRGAIAKESRSILKNVAKYWD